MDGEAKNLSGCNDTDLEMNYEIISTIIPTGFIKKARTLAARTENIHIEVINHGRGYVYLIQYHRSEVKIVEKGYKYRIYPNKKQKEIIAKTFGCAKFIYNKMLGDRLDYYKETGKKLNNTPIFIRRSGRW